MVPNMNDDNIDVLLENQSLKNEFKLRGLDLAEVFFPIPENLERENNILRHLLDWVQKYRECPDRKRMEADGYHFPPIDPDISPDDDWYRFELWMQGKPTRMRLIDQLPPNFTPIPPEHLTENGLQRELKHLQELLFEIHISVELNPDVPQRLIYEHLLELLHEKFELTQEGCWHVNGCSGYCPGCFQRPWCAAGTASCWTEDEEAGKMFLPPELKNYVSASPGSLQILQKLQAEEDKKFEEFKRSQKDSDLTIDPLSFDFDEDDDLPF
ncbi:MAG: hypothetical protein ACE5HS_05595 [bacterium]